MTEPPLSYPQMQPPPVGRPRPPRPPLPSVVTIAAALSVLAVACWTASTLVSGVRGDGNGGITFYTSRTVQTGPNTFETVTNSGPAPLGLVIGVTVIVAALWLLLLIFLMRAGQNWSRILLVIFGCLGILAELFTTVNAAGYGVSSAAQAVELVLSILVCGLVAASIVLMFLEPAKVYFRRR